MMTSWQVITDLWYWNSPAWLIVIFATFIFSLAAVSQPMTWRQITCFVFAAGTFVVALASPLAVLASRYSFSAHMAQHLLLLLIVPLCAILAWPPSGIASSNLGQAASPGRVLPGWLAGIGAMWFWHVPLLCTAAMQNAWVFAIQACSLVAAGAAFWWPVFQPRLQKRMQPQMAAVYLFSGCIGCSLLGIYITFSPVSVCPLYAISDGSDELMRLVHEQWGMSCRLDQQIGGLLMWVPACMVYLGAILVSLSSWYRVPQQAAFAAE